MAAGASAIERDVERREVRVAEPPRAVGGVRFDWAMIALTAWPLVGAYLDAWAHNHFALETFFTPWHAALYSGFLAVTCFLVAMPIVNHRKGYDWRYTLPAGYGLSLLGVAVLVVGGIGDTLWHLAFGIERQFDAALSPTHLLLAAGIGLVVSGPLRAAWRRPTNVLGVGWRGWVAQLPMLLSLTFTLSLLTLITQYAHPFVRLWAADPYRTVEPDLGQQLGVLGIVLQAGLLMGLVLLALRRWRLMPGSLALIFTLNAVLLSFMRDHYAFILVALLAGVAADLLLWLLRPSPERSGALRLFAFAVPTILYLLYFLTLRALYGVWWSIHLWLGAAVLAGIAGWLLSCLVVPPSMPIVE
jgi:hypothetical protein